MAPWKPRSIPRRDYPKLRELESSKWMTQAGLWDFFNLELDNIDVNLVSQFVPTFEDANATGSLNGVQLQLTTELVTQVLKLPYSLISVDPTFKLGKSEISAKFGLNALTKCGYKISMAKSESFGELLQFLVDRLCLRHETQYANDDIIVAAFEVSKGNTLNWSDYVIDKIKKEIACIKRDSRKTIYYGQHLMTIINFCLQRNAVTSCQKTIGPVEQDEGGKKKRKMDEILMNDIDPLKQEKVLLARQEQHVTECITEVTMFMRRGSCLQIQLGQSVQKVGNALEECKHQLLYGSRLHDNALATSEVGLGLVKNTETEDMENGKQVDVSIMDRTDESKMVQIIPLDKDAELENVKKRRIELGEILTQKQNVIKNQESLVARWVAEGSFFTISIICLQSKIGNMRGTLEACKESLENVKQYLADLRKFLREFRWTLD